MNFLEQSLQRLFNCIQPFARSRAGWSLGRPAISFWRSGTTSTTTRSDTPLLPSRFFCDSDRERLPGNLHRAYTELKGEPLGPPLPLPAVFQDIIAYNSGQMPRCLA